jgi:hypothetical protein
MKCTSCNDTCYDNSYPEIVFLSEKECICENCSIDYDEKQGEFVLREFVK